MNRHEVETRLRTVEAKLKFVMHTLALTQTNNKTGAAQSQTFDTLFETAVANGMDAATVTDVAGDSGTGTGATRPATSPEKPGADVVSAAGPDGVP